MNRFRSAINPIKIYIYKFPDKIYCPDYQVHKKYDVMKLIHKMLTVAINACSFCSSDSKSSPFKKPITEISTT
jgi:hypothetical protein